MPYVEDPAAFERLLLAELVPDSPTVLAFRTVIARFLVGEHPDTHAVVLYRDRARPEVTAGYATAVWKAPNRPHDNYFGGSPPPPTIETILTDNGIDFLEYTADSQDSVIDWPDPTRICWVTSRPPGW